MIFKFLKLIVSLLLIAFIAILISETEGNTKIDWLGWGIEIETSYLVLILAFFCHKVFLLHFKPNTRSHLESLLSFCLNPFR